jgi:hypothetical protein
LAVGCCGFLGPDLQVEALVEVAEQFLGDGGEVHSCDGVGLEAMR